MVELDESRRHDLAQVLGEVARNLDGEGDENETLSGIVAAAVATVPGVVSGGITQVHRRRVFAKTPSDDLVSLCDKAQDEFGEGPCLDAIWSQHTVIVDDFATETRWPSFAARATELGAGSLISFQLYVRDDTLGALNLYGGTGVRFGDEARLVGEVFATHAALALAGARHSRQLNEALASRDAIGQAKGLLMAQQDLTGQQAFDLLVRASQESNLKLTDVATWLIHNHEHPSGDNRPRNTPTS